MEVGRVRRGLAVTLVFTVFLAVVTFLLLGILPRLSFQLAELAQQSPDMIARGQQALLLLPKKYPTRISVDQVGTLVVFFAIPLATLVQTVLKASPRSDAPSMVGA